MNSKIKKAAIELTGIFLGISLVISLAFLKSNGSFKSDGAKYSKKEAEIRYDGIYLDLTFFYKNNELTKIEGKLYLLNSLIYDEDSDESTITFWSKKYGYSSTCESLFKILSESHKREIENQFFKDH